MTLCTLQDTTVIILQDFLCLRCYYVYEWLCVDSDLNYLEETSGGPNLTLATLPKSNKIVLVQVCVCVCMCLCV